MLKNYKLFLNEFNRKDLHIINLIEDYFTIAFEFEIKTDNEKLPPPKGYFVDDLIDYFKKEIIEYIKNKIDIIKYNEFIDNLLLKVDLHDEMDPYLDSEIYNDENQKYIVTILQFIIEDYIKKLPKSTEEPGNLLKLEKAVKKHLPNFYNKWNKELDFTFDMHIGRGVEIKPKKYVIGIKKSLEMLKDFFDDFNKQEYWYMDNNKTALHINISINPKYDFEFNLLKGTLLIKDYVDEPYVFKDNQIRKGLKFTQSIFIELVKYLKDKNIKIDLHNIKEIEKKLNKIIYKIFDKYGEKTFGLNLIKIKKYGYVEFRYPGGIITEDIIKNKLLFFCYIIYCMVNENYKKREYYKLLYKFIPE